MGFQEDKTKKERATEIFLSNMGLVQTVAFERAPSYDLSEDIVHDVFVNFIENADRWDFNRDLRPLLSQIRRIAKSGIP